MRFQPNILSQSSNKQSFSLFNHICSFTFQSLHLTFHWRVWFYELRRLVLGDIHFWYEKEPFGVTDLPSVWLQKVLLIWTTSTRICLWVVSEVRSTGALSHFLSARDHIWTTFFMTGARRIIRCSENTIMLTFLVNCFTLMNDNTRGVKNLIVIFILFILYYEYKKSRISKIVKSRSSYSFYLLSFCYLLVRPKLSDEHPFEFWPRRCPFVKCSGGVGGGGGAQDVCSFARNGHRAHAHHRPHPGV
jgi:hypothetical protein